MKVTFIPSPCSDSLTGVVSFLSWGNPKLQVAIRAAFAEEPGERITEIAIRQDGIKAKFESIYPNGKGNQ